MKYERNDVDAIDNILWRILCTSGITHNGLREYIETSPKEGELVLITAAIYRAEQRLGHFISVELEEYPEQDDVEFRGKDWTPAVRDVWTLESVIDGQVYRWENVKVFRVPPMIKENKQWVIINGNI